MDRQKAIKELENIRDNFNYTLCPNEVFNMAISDMHKLSYITDRPCAVCKFNEDGNGCKKWTCVFEDDGKENT